MEGSVVDTHTIEDVKRATNEAFLKPGERQPAIKNTMAEPAPAAVIPSDQQPPEPAPAAITPALINYDEMPDEEFDKILAKRTKGAVKSISDLQVPPPTKTKEELAAQEEKKKADALAWKLSTGNIKREDYETALGIRSKTNREIALSLFSDEMKEIDPKITADEVEEYFRDYYREELDDTDPKRTILLKEMNSKADGFKKEKAGFIDTIDPEYRAFNTKQQNIKAIGKQIDTVFDALPAELTSKGTYKKHLSAKPEGEDAEIEIPYTIEDADFKAIKKEVRSHMMNYLNEINADPKDIKDADIQNQINLQLKSRLWDKVVPLLISQAAEKGKMDTLAEAKAIPIRQPNFTTAQTTQTTKTRVFTPEEKAAM